MLFSWAQFCRKTVYISETITALLAWYWVWPAAGWRTRGLGPVRALRCRDPGLPCVPLERIGPMWWYAMSATTSSGVPAANCRPLKSGSDPVLLATDGTCMPLSCLRVGWMLQLTPSRMWYLHYSQRSHSPVIPTFSRHFKWIFTMQQQ